MDNWQRHLDHLAQSGMLRTLRTVGNAQGPRVLLEGREVLLLCSNNYLGLASHPRLAQAAAAAALDWGTSSGASRLVSGTLELHRELEERIASFKGTEAALLFNSGYAANTGILQGLTGPEDVIFSDALNHASIIDGCRLSQARTLVYPHGDVAALEQMMMRLRPSRRGRWFIVTDGVFSMDGDLAPLPALADLRDRYDALLMVDDAHGTGVLGNGGRGSGEALGCLTRIDLHMGTLGKALGGFGAYLAAARPIIETLINRSRPFIFSTSLPPSVLAAAKAAFDLVEEEEGRRRREALQRNCEIFATPLRQAGLDLCGSVTQIVPIVTGDPQPTMAAAAALFERGIFLQGIRPPTVPQGRCRLRATLMSDHDPQELQQAAAAIIDVLTLQGILVP